MLDLLRNRLSCEPFDNASDKDNVIHFLPTESSDAILLESCGHFALIDCAEDKDNPRGFEWLRYRGYENEVLEYVKKVAGKDGKAHLDFILGTHAHSDHIGGFDTLLSDESVTVGRAYLKRYDESRINAHEVERWDNKEVYEQTVNALNKRNIPIIFDIKETEFKLGKMNIKLFNTEYDTVNIDIGENDNSIGVLVELYSKRVFLAGDIDNKTGDEDRLAPLIGKVDVLKVGHHSYAYSTSEGWLKTLMPEVCVVTNDYKNTDKTTLKRIIDICASPILITGEERGVAIAFNPDSELKYYNNI
ncbi:MAG: MBL fold metallo-hydrolase [Eubacterium sp.]|nr:MBL fold metallo-hydrolase [Eubacterium sp.]